MAHEPTALRDAGLRRVSRLTRAGIVGGLAATGVFAALAAHGFAGTTDRQATAPSAAQGSTASTTTPPQGGSTATSSSAGQSTSSVTSPLKAPTTAVRPSTRSGRVASGGS